MAKQIQWHYHRAGWTSCIRAQEFLANAGIEPKEIEKPTKPPYQKAKVKDLLSKANKVFAAKGNKRLEVNLKEDKVSDEDINKFMLGPTGNLRAPTMVIGETLLIGFNDELYKELLGWNYPFSMRTRE